MKENSFVNDDMTFATIVEENGKFRAYFDKGDIPYTKHYDTREALIHYLKIIGFYNE